MIKQYKRTAIEKEPMYEFKLKYKDVKDIVCFYCVLNSSIGFNRKWWDRVKVIHLNPHLRGTKLFPITLEDALVLLKEKPLLFNTYEVLHLYKLVQLYDNNVFGKLKKRLDNPKNKG